MVAQGRRSRGGSIVFSLPKPPTVNTIYKYSSAGGFARSYISAAGQQWFAAASRIVASTLAAQYPDAIFPFTVPIALTLELHTARYQDIDGFLKPVLDVLSNVCLACFQKGSTRKKCPCGQNKSLMQDDALVTSLMVTKIKVPHKTDEKVLVTCVPA